MTAECTVYWTEPIDHPRLRSLLTDPERARAARLPVADSARFVTGRALVRLLLADRLRVAPEAVPVEHRCATCGSSAHGKPRLGTGRPAFNVAHTAGRVGVAISDRRQVGLDVEALADASGRPGAHGRDGASIAGHDPEPMHAALADVALSPDERAVYDSLPPSARPAASLRWWTRKEAVLKATGTGLATSPNLVRVTSPDETAAVLAGATDVALHDLQPGSGYVAALAIVGGAASIVTERDASDILAARIG